MKKRIGTKYDFIVRGDWRQIYQASRKAKNIVERSNPLRIQVDPVLELEERILRAWIIPRDGEEFRAYKKRVAHIYSGDGFGGKITSLLLSRRVPFDLNFDYGDGSMIVSTTTRPNRYDLIVSGTGSLEKKSSSIADDFKGFLNENSMTYANKSSGVMI